MTDMELGAACLADALKNLRTYKKMGEEAMAQVDDASLLRQIDPEANSIAMLVKHMAGNMRSRWTDFLTTDGEKPDRHRDQEFVAEPGLSRAAVIERWEAGWKCVLSAVEALRPDQLRNTVTIAGKKHTALEALNRQLLHYAGHVNQIVLLAKHFAGPAWKSLSIPKGQSETYAREFEKKLAARGA